MNPTVYTKSEVEWDPKRGFRISLGPFDNYPLITCVTSVDNRQFSSNYILFRISESFLLLKGKTKRCLLNTEIKAQSSNSFIEICHWKFCQLVKFPKVIFSCLSVLSFGNKECPHRTRTSKSSGRWYPCPQLLWRDHLQWQNRFWVAIQQRPGELWCPGSVWSKSNIICSGYIFGSPIKKPSQTNMFPFFPYYYAGGLVGVSPSNTGGLFVEFRCPVYVAGINCEHTVNFLFLF